MTNQVFTKQYACAAARFEAVGNYAWLAAAANTLVLPAIRAADAHWIEFEHVDGRHLRPDDLPAYARHLGMAHAAAWSVELRHACLDRPHESTIQGTSIRDFVTPRARLVGPSVLLPLAHGPAAFYKDANLRNTLIAPAGEFVTVDFDSLTLAPFGYDLAKCVVSLAMTYGHSADAQVRTAWAAYNDAVAAYEPSLATTWPAFVAMTDLNARLTAPYLGRHGYAHAWRGLDQTSKDVR